METAIALRSANSKTFLVSYLFLLLLFEHTNFYAGTGVRCLHRRRRHHRYRWIEWCTPSYLTLLVEWERQGKSIDQCKQTVHNHISQHASIGICILLKQQTAEQQQRKKKNWSAYSSIEIRNVSIVCKHSIQWPNTNHHFRFVPVSIRLCVRSLVSFVITIPDGCVCVCHSTRILFWPGY